MEHPSAPDVPRASHKVLVVIAVQGSLAFANSTDLQYKGVQVAVQTA